MSDHDELLRRIHEVLARSLALPEWLFGAASEQERATTTATDTSAALTAERLQEMLDQVNTVYDRRRGDLPEERMVLDHAELVGLIDKIVRVGDQQCRVYVGDRSIVVDADCPIVILKVPKPSFELSRSSVYGEDSILFPKFLRDQNSGSITYPNP